MQPYHYFPFTLALFTEKNLFWEWYDMGFRNTHYGPRKHLWVPTKYINIENNKRNLLVAMMQAIQIY